MALTTKRIIALPSQSDPQEGDYLAIDNATSGTHKIPVGRIGVEVDDTLTEAGKAADAKAVGDALDELRSQIEVTGTASGAIATFTDGADMPMVACTASIVPKQSGSGTPSPDNVRAISGWESVNVNVTGKNLLDPQTIVTGKYYNNVFVEITNADKAHSGIIPIKSNTSYCLNGFGGQGFYSMLALDADKNPIAWFGGASKTAPFVATTPSNAYYMVLNFNADQTDTIAFYESASVDGYIPYNGHTTTTPLGRTVYGGTLDVVTGVLTVDRAMVDLGTLNWTYNVADETFYTALTSAKRPCTLICSHYPQDHTASVQEMANKTIWNKRYAYTPTNVVIKDTDYTDAASFKTAMSGAQLCYELATPQTYTLTGQEISTLLGNNNVWADCGDVEVVYVRDLNIVINNLLNSNGTRSLGMMAMSTPTEATAEEPTDEQSDEQTEEPAEDDMR